MRLSKEQKGKKFSKYIVVIALLVITMFCISACSDGGMQGEADIPAPPVMVLFPLSAEECVGMDAETLESTLSTAGFSNVSVEIIEDLTSAEAERVGKVQKIEIAGSATFLKGQQFEENAEIVIFQHEFKECKVIVKVEFIPNLFFNKYDVEVLFDGELVGTMEHGVDGTFEYSAYPGEYTVLFDSTSTTACGENTLSIAWDAEVSYRITCWGDEIVVTLLYVDENVALTEGEIKLDKAANEYVAENYQSVVASFEKMGFTNIKCTPLYDIIWGITDEGAIEEVSIGGSTEYKRGNVVTKDTPIVITYHMESEDDPTKARMIAESSEYKGQNYLDVEAELKALGFENIKTVENITNDLNKVDGSVVTVLADNDDFYDGERFDKDVKIVITYWKTKGIVDVQPEPEQSPSTDVILPPSGSKLAKDLDYISESTACYINVDGVSNKPSVRKWNTATVTDGVAQYFDYLEELGFAVHITDQTEKEPYAGYHYYETDFKVSNDEASWTMTLIIQDEDYTEYQLDIDL